MSETKVFAPFRCVASFADGSRLTFDGFSRGQARASMEDAMQIHGDYGPWDWVTDENYIGGEYVGRIPPPPRLPFPILDLTDCKTEEERRRALQDPFRPDDIPAGE